MVSINVYKNQDSFTGFACRGHAGFAESGSDIVCAAVSMLVINTVNALEAYTDCKMQVQAKEKDGLLEVLFSEKLGKEAKLLIDTMLLGLETASEQYGSKYVKIVYKEG